MIHAVDFAPQIHKFTQFLYRGHFCGLTGRLRDCDGGGGNRWLLKHDIETGIGRNGDADVLRICRVRQLLFAGKRHVACQAISQQRLASNGPAQAGGVQPGDVILSFDGKPVSDMRHLPRLVAETGVGKSAPVKVWRKRQEATLQVKLGKLDETEQVAAKEGPKDKAPKSYEDLVDAKLSPAWAGKMAIPPYVSWLVELSMIWSETSDAR